MIEPLASTVARIEQVVVSVHSLQFLPVAQYRSTAMRLMWLMSDDEIRDDVADVRRFLWMRVAQVLRTPCEWSAAWQREATSMLIDFQSQNRWGQDVASAVHDFVLMTQQLHDIGSNPLRQAFLSILDSIPADENIGVVLPAQRELASVFKGISHPTLPSERLLSEGQLRRSMDRFDCLLTLGRFDDLTPHHLFSAPHWTRVLNLRWSGDNDDEDLLPLLPVFSIGAGAAAGGVAHGDNPACRWVVWEHRNEVVPYTQQPEPIGVVDKSTPWRASDFDDLFRPRRRDRSPTLMPLYSGYAVWVALSSSGGSYVGIDEQGRSRPVWVLDEEDGTRVMHCISNSTEQPEQRPVLDEGCIVMVPLAPQRTDGARVAVDLTRRERWWKAKLASRIARYSAVHVASELRGYGLGLAALANAVSRWTTDNAPQEEGNFKILVRDYLGMRHSDPDEESATPWWQMAWDDIVELRRANQSAGQHRRWQQDAMSDEVVKREYTRIVDEVDRLGISYIQVDEDYTLACGRVHHICRAVNGRGYRLPVEECGYYVGPESAPDACSE